MSSSVRSPEIAQASLEEPLLAEFIAALRTAPALAPGAFDLSEAQAEMLARLGLKRALTPPALGGDGLSLTAALAVIEAISAVDGHAGRIASYAPMAACQAAATGTSAPGLDDEHQAIALFPLAPLVKRDGRLLVSGRWEMACGFTSAAWLTVGVMGKGVAQTVTLPRNAVLLELATEPVSNLVSRKCFMVAHEVEIDPRFVVDAAVGAAGFLPLDLAYCAALAAVSLGAARGALDALNDLAAGKTSITGGPLLAERVYAQTAVGRSEIGLWSARIYLHEQVAAYCAAYAPAQAALRRAISVATDAAQTVAQTAFEIAGTTAIFLNNPIQRLMRDVNTANQLAERAERAGGWPHAA